MRKINYRPQGGLRNAAKRYNASVTANGLSAIIGMIYHMISGRRSKVINLTIRCRTPLIPFVP